MSFCIGLLLHGVVVETSVKSLTGRYFYSDEAPDLENELNSLARIPVVGIVIGVNRIIFGILHALGHLFAALFTCKAGHLFHALKGICETLRGIIEAIPIIGRIFANLYGQGLPCHFNYHSWWMIKIYNPQNPDGLDRHRKNWVEFPQRFYVNLSTP